MRHNPLTRDSPMYDVVVEAHDVVGQSVTYHVERKECRIGACGDADGARMRVLLWAHMDAGVPPWKPYLRLSWPYVKVTRYMVQVI
jgi:hypothetical protein